MPGMLVIGRHTQLSEEERGTSGSVVRGSKALFYLSLPLHRSKRKPESTRTERRRHDHRPHYLSKNTTFKGVKSSSFFLLFFISPTSLSGNNFSTTTRHLEFKLFNCLRALVICKSKESHSVRLEVRMDNGGFWERKQDNSDASVLGRVCLLVNTLQSKQVNGEPGENSGGGFGNAVASGEN